MTTWVCVSLVNPLHGCRERHRTRKAAWASLKCEKALGNVTRIVIKDETRSGIRAAARRVAERQKRRNK
jgi:hypothetical protein